MSVSGEGNGYKVVSSIPTVKCDILPYVHNHKEQLLAPNLSELLMVTGDGKIFPCTFCNASINLNEMREHVAYHFLKTPGLLKETTCGFCGLGGCTTVLIKTKNGTQKPESDCKRFYSFRVSMAEKVSKRNPRTNILILCPSCPPEEKKYVWKYCLAAHMKSHHNGISVPAKFEITKEERVAMMMKKG